MTKGPRYYFMLGFWAAFCLKLGQYEKYDDLMAECRRLPRIKP